VRAPFLAARVRPSHDARARLSLGPLL
jgi:hypothetical protein